MSGWGGDAEAYIEAVRDGAIDPFGQTADELQASLDEFDEQLRERLLAMSDDEIDEMICSGSPIPPLPASAEPDARRVRADEVFARRMRVLETQAARIEGERRALMAEHLQRAIEEPGDAGVAVRELALTAAVELGLSGPTVERRMTEAWELITGLPVAHASAAAGRLTTAHLRVIEGETRALRHDAAVSAEERAAVERELVAIAETTTPGRLRRRAKRIVDAALTAPLQQRHDAARARRSVELIDAGDGMCDVNARVPALEGAAILDRLTQAARGKAKDDPRTFDQFRADAFMELLLAGQAPEDVHGTSAITAHVAIMIPATELLRDEQQEEAGVLRFPASLDGRVLVDRDTARRIAGGAGTWERLFTDPVSGVAVTVDTYRPSAEQKRWLQARDGWCRAPGCSNPARRSDLDHTDDWADGGRTSIDNLGHLCRRDHTLKHASRWRVQQLQGGILEWTSPTGRVIADEPEPIAPRFVSAAAARPSAARAPAEAERVSGRARYRELFPPGSQRVFVATGPPPGVDPSTCWGGSPSTPSDVPPPAF